MSETRINDAGIHFNVGDTVRLRDKGQTAKIEGFYAIQWGGVLLDRELDGLRSWNVNDLERVPTPVLDDIDADYASAPHPSAYYEREG